MDTCSVTPCLSIVHGSKNNEKPRSAKRRKSDPGLPQEISSALKGFESGALDLVYVTGVVDGEKRLFSVSAGIRHELLDIFYEPFLPAATPSINGNVIFLQRAPTAIEQINAVGMAFTAGKLSSLNLLIRYTKGRTELKKLK